MEITYLRALGSGSTQSSCSTTGQHCWPLPSSSVMGTLGLLPMVNLVPHGQHSLQNSVCSKLPEARHQDEHLPFKFVFHFFYPRLTDVTKDTALTWLYRANTCDSLLYGKIWFPTCGTKNLICICGFSASSSGRALSTKNRWGNTYLLCKSPQEGPCFFVPFSWLPKLLLGTRALLWKLVCELLVTEPSWRLVTLTLWQWS